MNKSLPNHVAKIRNLLLGARKMASGMSLSISSALKSHPNQIVVMWLMLMTVALFLKTSHHVVKFNVLHVQEQDEEWFWTIMHARKNGETNL